MISKKTLTNRWNNPDFVRSVQHYLDHIFRDKSIDEAADLRGITAGLDGPVEYLYCVDYQDAFATRVDFSYSSFSCSFNGGKFRGLNLSNSNVDRCRFSDAFFERSNFQKCDLVRPWLDLARFSECTFKSGKIRGRGGPIADECGRRILFERSDFSGSKFRLIEIRGVQFVNCCFDDTLFDRCFVFNWRFTGNVPSMTQFIDCEYRGENTGLTLPN